MRTAPSFLINNCFDKDPDALNKKLRARIFCTALLFSDLCFSVCLHVLNMTVFPFRYSSFKIHILVGFYESSLFLILAFSN